MKIPRQRGIVLISILVLTLLATFFIGALIQMNPSRLRRAVHDERHDMAAAAAKAGVDFALAKLAQEPDWKAQGQGLLVKSDQLVVRQDRGNVWGWIRAKEGEWTGFCFRFNYQDGADGADGLPQPGQIMPFAGISVNNLRGPSPVPLPLGDGPDYSFAGKFGYDVPEYSVALLVQGIVGPEVAPDKYPRDEKSSIVVRQVEGLYKASGLAGLPDGAVLQAGGDSDFILGAQNNNGRGHLRLMADGQIAKMRTKGNSRIQQGAGKQADYNFYPDLDAEVRVGGTFTSKDKNDQIYSKEAEKPNDPMLDIEWSKVSQSTQTDRLKIPAGVYAVSSGGGSDRVKYYDMTFEEYREALISKKAPTASPLPQNFPPLEEKKVTIDGKVDSRDLIEFDRDVEVTPGAKSNKNLAIVPAGGAKQQEASAGYDPAAFRALNPEEKTKVGEAVLAYIGVSRPFELQVGGERFSYNPEAKVQGWDSSTLAEALWNSNGNVSLVGGEGYAVEDGWPRRNLFSPEEFLDKLPPLLRESGDPLSIPDSVMSDPTTPQDVEIHFAPASGKSAAIRTDGNVLLGAHLSGKGGAVVAGGRVDLIGLGIDIEANSSEHHGISVYAQDVINISTYDERKQKYWDASIKGVMFSRKEIRVRLGEQSRMVSPEWGVFDFQGVMIALGDAASTVVDNIAVIQSPESGGVHSPNSGSGTTDDGELVTWSQGTTGYVNMIADGIRLTYEPKFLAPYVKADQVILTFQAVSVVER